MHSTKSRRRTAADCAGRAGREGRFAYRPRSLLIRGNPRNEAMCGAPGPYLRSGRPRPARSELSAVQAVRSFRNSLASWVGLTASPAAAVAMSKAVT